MWPSLHRWHQARTEQTFCKAPALWLQRLSWTPGCMLFQLPFQSPHLPVCSQPSPLLVDTKCKQLLIFQQGDWHPKAWILDFLMSGDQHPLRFISLSFWSTQLLSPHYLILCSFSPPIPSVYYPPTAIWFHLPLTLAYLVPCIIFANRFQPLVLLIITFQRLPPPIASQLHPLTWLHLSLCFYLTPTSHHLTGFTYRLPASASPHPLISLYCLAPIYTLSSEA